MSIYDKEIIHVELNLIDIVRGGKDIDRDDIIDKAEQLDDGTHQVTAEEARDHIDDKANPHEVTKDQVGLGNVPNLDTTDAISKAHEHDNKSLLDSYDQANEDIKETIEDSHTHDNKALLDTYTQTEEDIADAISKEHVQNTDTKLDEGGANEIDASEIVKAGSITEVIYYINCDTGSDETGDGSSETPFATVQHAIDLLPKILRYQVQIILSNSLNYNEAINIKGFSSATDANDCKLLIKGSGNPDNVLITNENDIFTIDNCFIPVWISYLSMRVTADDKACVSAKFNSLVRVYRCDFADNDNNNTIGVSSDTNSHVYVDMGNNYDSKKVGRGLYSSSGGILTHNNSSFGDISKVVSNGGVILNTGRYDPDRIGVDRSYETHASDIRSAVDNSHTHDNKSELDLVSDGDHDVRTDNPHDVTVDQLDLASGTVASDIDDAIDKKHTQGTDTTLGAQEADLDMNDHSIINLKDDSITFKGGGSLNKADYEDSVSKKHTQNTDTKLDEGGDNEIDVENVASISKATFYLKSRIPDPSTITFTGLGLNDLDASSVALPWGIAGFTGEGLHTFTVKISSVASGEGDKIRYKVDDGEWSEEKEIVGYQNIATGGTPTASYGLSTYVDNPVDRNFASYWYFANYQTTAPYWWKYDLGEGNEKIVKRLKIKQSGIKRALIQGSNNDSDWTTLKIITPEYSNYTYTVLGNIYDINNDISYRYYRIYMESEDDIYETRVQIYELELMEQITGSGYIELEDDVFVKFSADTGHTVDDQWSFEVNGISDNNDGTSTLPFASINKAMSIIQKDFNPKGSLQLEQGIYVENISITDFMGEEFFIQGKSSSSQNPPYIIGAGYAPIYLSNSFGLALKKMNIIGLENSCLYAINNSKCSLEDVHFGTIADSLVSNIKSIYVYSSDISDNFINIISAFNFNDETLGIYTPKYGIYARNSQVHALNEAYSNLGEETYLNSSTITIGQNKLLRNITKLQGALVTNDFPSIGSLLAQKTFLESEIGTDYSDIEVIFDNPPTIVAGEKYTISFTSINRVSLNYQIRFKNPGDYAGGIVTYTKIDGTDRSSSDSFDFDFEVYINDSLDVSSSGGTSSFSLPTSSDYLRSQSFTAVSSGNLTKLVLPLKKRGSNVGDLIVRIYKAEQSRSELIEDGELVDDLAVTAGKKIGSKTIEDIEDAVDKKHTQNSDTKLDEGGENEVIASDIKDAISKEHEHSNKSELDLVSDGDHDVRTDNPHDVTVDQLDLASGTVASDIDDAIDKKHTQNTDTKLDEGGENEIGAGEIVKASPTGAYVRYYVNPDTGSDDNPGTEAEPFATIQHAVDILPKILRRTTYIRLQDSLNYNETVSVSGFSSNENITFAIQGQNADNVLISGSSAILLALRENHMQISIYGISFKTNHSSGACIRTYESDLYCYNCKFSDNGGTGTSGIYVTSNSKAYVFNCSDYDSNKVRYGLRTGLGGIIMPSTTSPSFGDTYKYGLIIEEGLHTPAQATKVLYVDKNNTSNTEIGSITDPFKTIQGAINQIIANGDDSYSEGYTIKIGAGRYIENLVLENNELQNITFEGISYEATKIVPSSGNSLQSTLNNSTFRYIYFKNLWFNTPVILQGSTNGGDFGHRIHFQNCLFSNTVTMKNLVSSSFFNCKFSDNVLISNVVEAAISGYNGYIYDGNLTLETDDTAYKPNYFTSDGTIININAIKIYTDLAWSLLNGGKGIYDIKASLIGGTGGTIPTDGTIKARHSTLLGNYTNNGTLELYNSHISGTLSGNAPILYQPSSQIKNDSSVTGTTVKDALNNCYEKETELKIKVYIQDTEPTLTADQFMAVWHDTSVSGDPDIYLLYRRGSGDQVKIQFN